MTYFLLTLCSLGWFLAWYFWRTIETGDPKRWRTEFPPEGAVRGPNADTSYQAVNLNDTEHWFTAEQVEEAKERARKYAR